MRRGFTLVELLIVVFILLFAGALFSSACVNAPRAALYRYDVVGTVSHAPGTKQNFGNQGGETKYSIPLRDIESPERPVKYASKVAAINCTSTQCATLGPGAIVSFSCYDEMHFFEPNEEECRFFKLLENEAS